MSDGDADADADVEATADREPRETDGRSSSGGRRKAAKNGHGEETNLAAADPVAVDHRPAWFSGGVAVLAAVLALVVLERGGIRAALVVEGAGVALAAVGRDRYRRGERVPGVALAGLGVVVVLGAVAVGVSGAPAASRLLWLAGGGVGVGLVGAGALAAVGDGSRRLVTAGVVVTFLAVVLSGLFGETSLTTLLASGALVIVAGDTGEHAINVGEQLGRSTRTLPLELAHAGGSLAVGVVAVVAGTLVDGISNPNLSLTSFVLLLIAVTLFGVALRR